MFTALEVAPNLSPSLWKVWGPPVRQVEWPEQNRFNSYLIGKER